MHTSSTPAPPPMRVCCSGVARRLCAEMTAGSMDAPAGAAGAATSADIAFFFFSRSETTLHRKKKKERKREDRETIAGRGTTHPPSAAAPPLSIMADDQAQLPPGAAGPRALVASAASQVLATHVEPADDMRAERGRATFDPVAVSAFLHGGADKVASM